MMAIRTLAWSRIRDVLMAYEEVKELAQEKNNAKKARIAETKRDRANRGLKKTV